MEEKEKETSEEMRALVDIVPRFRSVQGFQLFEDSSVSIPGDPSRKLNGKSGEWFLLFDFGRALICSRFEFEKYFKVK